MKLFILAQSYKVDPQFNYIAQDDNGNLYAYAQRPVFRKSTGLWHTVDGAPSVQLDSRLALVGDYATEVYEIPKAAAGDSVVLITKTDGCQLPMVYTFVQETKGGWLVNKPSGEEVYFRKDSVSCTRVVRDVDNLTLDLQDFAADKGWISHDEQWRGVAKHLISKGWKK